MSKKKKIKKSTKASTEDLANDYSEASPDNFVVDIEDDELIEDTPLIEDGDIDNFDIIFQTQQNQHKIEGKHSLKRDVIFHGRLDKQPEEGEEYITTSNSDFDYSAGYEMESDSGLDLETRGDDGVRIQKELEEAVYNVLVQQMGLDFSQNRRKPKKEDFNKYFQILIELLHDRFTLCEIFISLSYYFTDNIYNMFKILDKKWTGLIIRELKDKGYLKDLGNVNFI